MSQQKLIEQLSLKNPGLKKSECEYILNIFLRTIINGLKEAKTIEIRGLGRWYWKILKENYNARNPLTNELIYKPERAKLKFKTSRKLNKIINE